MAVGAVIFDMDGVLIDSEPVHIESWLILFKKKGIPTEGIVFEKAIGMTDEQFLLDLKAEGRFDGEVRPLGREKQEIYAEIQPHRFKPQPGASEVVQGIAERLPVALATSDWRVNAERTVHRLGLQNTFRSVVCRDDVRLSKPDPEIYPLAASKLDVDPGVCVAVEDSPFGIRAAKAAGMRCIGVAASMPANWLTQADRVVQALTEVPETLWALSPAIGGRA